MSRLAKLALTGAAMVFATSHAQAASFETNSQMKNSAPLKLAPFTSEALSGKAEQRRGNRGYRGGARRGYRGAYRGSNRGYRGGRNVYRGNRGYRGRHYRRHRGRNFGLGLAAGVFLGSALSYPRYSSYGYRTYGYPAYGYPVYGHFGGYDRCRYRGRYYDVSFCYNFPYGYRRVYRSGHVHRHYHGRHCEHDRRHHGYYRDY